MGEGPARAGTGETGSISRAGLVPAVGFVLAGFGLAGSFLRWTPGVAVGPVESLPGLVSSVIALVAFGARRYGARDPRLSLVAGFGMGGLAIAAVVALLYPVVTGGPDVAVGIGLVAGFALGSLGVGVAYADWMRMDPAAFGRRSLRAAAALGIGVLGLLVGYVFAGVALQALPATDPLLERGISTAAFSVGLGILAVGFVAYTGRSLAYIDLRWLSRGDWLYVVGGVIGMFAILLAVGAVTTALGIPSSQHGIMAEARRNPTLLLAFIPLSLLAIGPGEELLSRNIIQKYLYGAYSRRGAVVVATAVFTVIHLPAYATAGPAAVFATLVRLFAVSLVLGVVYERTDNVIVSALVHGTYNAVQFGLAYVSLTTGYI
ncbi:MAG: lysostaphin resistance A-like protein [Halodesulfurarchaeum sp.]